MKKLIDQVIEYPNREFTLPKRFLFKKYNHSTIIELVIHKIKIFVSSIWLTLKKVFFPGYKSRYEIAVKKIVQVYEESKAKKVAVEIITSDEKESSQELEENIPEQIVNQRIEENSDEKELPIIESIPLPLKKSEETDTLTELVADTNQEETPSIGQTVSSPITPDREGQPETKNNPVEVPREDPKINFEEEPKASTRRVEKRESKPVAKSQYEIMNDDIKSKTGNAKLEKLWRSLLTNKSDIDSYIKEWSCDSDNEFVIRLKNPLHFWIDTDRIGGCVFSFASTIHGCLETNKIIFDEGFTSYCNHRVKKFITIDKRVEPKMNDIYFAKNNRVKMSGTCMGMTHTEKFSYSSLLEEWSNKVKVIPDNYHGGYKEYLEVKFKEQK